MLIECACKRKHNRNKKLNQCFNKLNIILESILLNKTVRLAEACAEATEGLHNYPSYNIINHK